MFDSPPPIMLLYHRPVPAKIPKRRSRAGEQSGRFFFFFFLFSPHLWLHYWFRQLASKQKPASFDEICGWLGLSDHWNRLRSLVRCVFLPQFCASCRVADGPIIVRKRKRNAMRNAHNAIDVSKEASDANTNRSSRARGEGQSRILNT